MKKRFGILLFLILILCFWIFFIPGPRVANDFPYIFKESLREGFNLPSSWYTRGAEGMGEYALLTLWSWPLDFIFSVFGFFSISFEVIERLFGVFLVLVIGIFSINKFLKNFKLSETSIFLGSFFYLTTTYFILLIDGGQILIGFAYAFFPFAYLLILRSFNDNLIDKIYAGLGVSTLSFFDIRFSYLLMILILIQSFYDLLFFKKVKFFGWVADRISSFFIILIIFSGTHIYWLFPLLSNWSYSLESNFSRLTKDSGLNFTSLSHSIFLLQPHWYKNVFGKIPSIKPEFVFIPVLVFLLPTLKMKSKEIGFWLLVAIISIFLTKGSNPPFGYMYSWFFSNLPGFSVFRDSTKFFFLVSLSYSVLIAYTFDSLLSKFNWKLNIKSWTIPILPFLFVAYLIMITSPVWMGKMTGLFSLPRNTNEYFKIAEILRNEKYFGRVLWIPGRPPLGFSSPNHPVVETSRVVRERPYAIGTVGTYEIFNFLREASFIGEILKISGISYLSYPYPDERRETLSQDNINYYYTFLEQLKNMPWVETVLSDVPVPLLKIKNTKDHFFSASNTYFIVGSDRIYWDLMKIPGFELSENALIFSEAKPNILGKINEIPHAKIIIYKKNSLDVISNFISKDRFIFPSEKLAIDPDETGWWMRKGGEIIDWRNFLQTKYKIDNLDFDYEGGWAVAEGEKALEIGNNSLEKGNILLVRVMKSKKGGRILFFQADKKIGEINTIIENAEKIENKLTGFKDTSDKIYTYDSADFYWFVVGELAFSDNLTIKTEGDINIVNSLISLKKEDFEGLKNQYEQFSNQGKLLVWEALSPEEKIRIFDKSEKGDIRYVRISPTHYKVFASNIKKPTTLVFSETFDSGWEMNSEKSFKLYDLVNGFYLKSDGIYDIYFSPQKYVYYGMIVSGISTIIIIVTIFKRKRVH